MENENIQDKSKIKTNQYQHHEKDNSERKSPKYVPTSPNSSPFLMRDIFHVTRFFDYLTVEKL